MEIEINTGKKYWISKRTNSPNRIANAIEVAQTQRNISNITVIKRFIKRGKFKALVNK